MKFHVNAADPKTGKDISFVTEAENAAEAEAQSTAKGFYVSSITPEPKATVPPLEPAFSGSPTPTTAVPHAEVVDSASGVAIAKVRVKQYVDRSGKEVAGVGTVSIEGKFLRLRLRHGWFSVIEEQFGVQDILEVRQVGRLLAFRRMMGGFDSEVKLRFETEGDVARIASLLPENTTQPKTTSAVNAAPSHARFSSSKSTIVSILVPYVTKQISEFLFVGIISAYLMYRMEGVIGAVIAVVVSVIFSPLWLRYVVKTNGSKIFGQIMVAIANLVVCSIFVGVFHAWQAGNPTTGSVAPMDLHTRASQGDAGAELELARAYLIGNKVEEDHKQAVYWFSKAADHGNPEAQEALGLLYRDGLFVERNPQRAIELFTKSANQLNAKAENDLGTCYGNGTGVVRDENLAVDWFKKAAEHGDVKGMYNLGAAYIAGSGIEKDETKAFEWLSKAAEKGMPEAMYEVGRLYLIGSGVARDDKKCVYWMQKAVENGNHQAEVILGQLYIQGSGVPKDISRGVQLMQKSADSGNADAIAALGYNAESGIGGPPDKAKAIDLYRKAAALGNDAAQQRLNILNEK